MKPTNLIQDYQLGLFFIFHDETPTHYVVWDYFGDLIHVNKTQAKPVRSKESLSICDLAYIDKLLKRNGRAKL